MKPAGRSCRPVRRPRTKEGRGLCLHGPGKKAAPKSRAGLFPVAHAGAQRGSQVCPCTVGGVNPAPQASRAPPGEAAALLRGSRGVEPTALTWLPNQ